MPADQRSKGPLKDNDQRDAISLDSDPLWQFGEENGHGPSLASSTSFSWLF